MAGSHLGEGSYGDVIQTLNNDPYKFMMGYLGGGSWAWAYIEIYDPKL